MTMGSNTDPGPAVHEGDVLAGKYRVEKVLGAGGMGVVVSARHLQLDERVAIKFLLPDALKNSEAVARFHREARAAVKIKSEHVARVIDVATLDNGSPYIVMEYLEGSDLSAWVRQRGPLPVDQAVEFVLQACEAIAEAHALGIVHRDLKPANLFCIRRADGLLSIKVLDFGISKMTAFGSGAPEMGMTRTQAMMGSPLYMSPEQMQSSKNVDARTDLWSLGVILFELVTGKVPFDGETITELVLRVAHEAPPSLLQLRADVPAGLEAVVLRCLEKDRNRRYLNVADLAVALGEFGPRRGRASVERVSRVMHEAELSTTLLASSTMTDAPAGAAGPGTSWGHTVGGARAGKTAVAGIAAVLAVGAGAFVVLHRSHDHAPVVTLTAASSAPVSAADARATAAQSAEPEPAVVPSASAVVTPEAAAAQPPAPAVTAPPVRLPHHRSSPPAQTASASARPTPPPTPQAPASAPPAYNPLDHL